MSEIAAAMSGETRWIRCPGCSGQIGVPPAWPSEAVCCPKCAAVVHIDERMRVLWRPAGELTPDVSPNDRDCWLACHGCNGEIGIPTDWLGPTIACPKCGAIVAMRETARVLWRPPAVTEAPGPRTPIRIRMPRRLPSDGASAWRVFAQLCGVVGVLFFAYVAGGIGTVAIPGMTNIERGGAVAADVAFCLAFLGWIFRGRQRFSVAMVIVAGGVLSAVVGDFLIRHSVSGVVTRIEELGGSVTWQGNGANRSVVAVDLHQTLVTDDDIYALAALPTIERLDLSETPVDGYSLDPVRRLRRLQWVSIYHTRASGDDIDDLAGDMPSVTIVDSNGFSGDARARQARKEQLAQDARRLEQQAEDALDNAMGFLRTNIDIGRQSLRWVTRDYPDTRAAKKAEITLERLDDPVQRYLITGRVQ